MKNIVVQYNSVKKIDGLIQNTHADSGKQTVIRNYPKAREFNCLPAVPGAYQAVGKDCLVAGMIGNRLIDELIRTHGLLTGKKRFTEGSYLIKKLAHKKGTTLLIVGADLSGFHYGLSDVARRLSQTATGIEYAGGERLESPCIPLRGWWNWDVRTRWNPDTATPVDWCCLLDYPESTAFFIDNMKRLVDGAVDYRVNAITIYGFIRDEHGGIEATQEICRYAADRGITMVPGIGTHGYGGFYYRGRHYFNQETQMQQFPERWKTAANKKRYPVPCPSDPQAQAWLREGVQWLFETFDIGGVFLENGDYYTCGCRRCRQAVKALHSQNPDFYQFQYLCYRPVLEELERIKKSRWNIHATYSCFSPLFGKLLDPLDPKYQPPVGDPRDNPLLTKHDKILREPPELAKKFPEAIAEWNIGGMLRNRIPLQAFLDDGQPAVVYQGPLWPKNLRSPFKRNLLGLYAAGGRLNLSRIKELCLRTHQGGYEAVMDYAETSPRLVQAEINYLALSHFSYHPKDTLWQFASAQLAPRVGGDAQARKFIEYVCKNEQGALTTAERKRIAVIRNGFLESMRAEEGRGFNFSADKFRCFTPYHYWSWLNQVDLKNGVQQISWC